MPIKPPKSLPTLRPYSIIKGFASKIQLRIAGSFAGTGAEYATLSPRITQTTLIIPSRNFQYAMPGGGTESFYTRDPKEVSATVFARLSGMNGTPAKASQTVTLGGAPVVGDVFTINLGGNFVSYVAVAGDTVVSVLAGHIAALLNSMEPALIAATNAGGVLTLTAAYNGIQPNTYGLTVYKKSIGGTIVAGGPTLAGGVDGKFFN